MKYLLVTALFIALICACLAGFVVYTLQQPAKAEYNPTTAPSMSPDGEVFVTPEYSYGALAALSVCLVAVVVVKIRNK